MIFYIGFHMILYNRSTHIEHLHMILYNRSTHIEHLHMILYNRSTHIEHFKVRTPTFRLRLPPPAVTGKKRGYSIFFLSDTSNPFGCDPPPQGAETKDFNKLDFIFWRSQKPAGFTACCKSNSGSTIFTPKR